MTIRTLYPELELYLIIAQKNSKIKCFIMILLFFCYCIALDLLTEHYIIISLLALFVNINVCGIFFVTRTASIFV